MVEVLGLLWGVELARRIGIQNFIVEGDSMIAIKETKGETKMVWDVILIIKNT